MLFEKIDELQKKIDRGDAIRGDMTVLVARIKDLLDCPSNYAKISFDIKMLQAQRFSGNDLRKASEAYKAQDKLQKIMGKLNRESSNTFRALKDVNIILMRTGIEPLPTVSPMEIAVSVQQEAIEYGRAIERGDVNLSQEITGDKKADIIIEAKKTQIDIERAKDAGAIKNTFMNQNIENKNKLNIINDLTKPRKPRSVNGKEPRNANVRNGELIVRQYPLKARPKGYDYEPVMLNVNLFNRETNKHEQRKLTAYYCKELNCYYADFAEYENLKRYGTILERCEEQENLKIVDVNGKQKLQNIHDEELLKEMEQQKDTLPEGVSLEKIAATASVLRQNGYHVAKKNGMSTEHMNVYYENFRKNGVPIPDSIKELMFRREELTDEERREILKNVVLSGQKNTIDIKEFLTSQIIWKQNNINYIDACPKYEADLEWMRVFERTLDEVGLLGYQTKNLNGDVDVKKGSVKQMDLEDLYISLNETLAKGATREVLTADVLGTSTGFKQKELKSAIKEIEKKLPKSKVAELKKNLKDRGIEPYGGSGGGPGGGPGSGSGPDGRN